MRRLGISLDGADAATHDAFRGWEGSFDARCGMLEAARQLGMAVQVNTTICRRNVGQVDAIAELLAGKGIAMWAVFFLVPVGRGVEEQRISPEEYEMVFERLFHHAGSKPYAVKTTEAPHYRRYVLQRGGNPLAGPRGAGRCASAPRPPRPRWASIDGRGIMFVGHTGEIYPAGFLPLCAAASRRIPWSRSTRSIRCFWPCAIRTVSRASAASASIARSAAAAAPGPTP